MLAPAEVVEDPRVDVHSAEIAPCLAKLNRLAPFLDRGVDPHGRNIQRSATEVEDDVAIFGFYGALVSEDAGGRFIDDTHTRDLKRFRDATQPVLEILEGFHGDGEGKLVVVERELLRHVTEEDLKKVLSGLGSTLVAKSGFGALADSERNAAFQPPQGLPMPDQSTLEHLIANEDLFVRVVDQGRDDVDRALGLVRVQTVA